MKTNVAVRTPPIQTHEGARAVRINAEQELRRSVMACLLWEDSFYESGVDIGQRIADLVLAVGLEKTAAIAEREKLPGKTCLVVDNSGSMYGTKISAKSEIDRSDAACAVAILLREVCEHVVIIAFSSHSAIVPPRRGFALRDAIQKSTDHGATNTDDALACAEGEGYDRIIVITDEQSHQTIRGPKGKGYFINVATYKNGIGYGKWSHIDGWSEAVVDYIAAAEQLNQ